MLGTDRQCNAKQIILGYDPTLDIKELQPVYSVIATPRQGKSLFLDVVGAMLHEKHKGVATVVPISFNSGTQFGSSSSLTDAGVCHEFWGRVVFELVRMGNPELEFSDFVAACGLLCADSYLAVEVAKKLGTPGS
jgi:hypothetical protein